MSQSLVEVKAQGRIFIFVGVCDYWSEMTLNSHTFNTEHPLLANEDRLNRIADSMYAKIHKTLFYGTSGRRRQVERGGSISGNDNERILAGTGASADDVLSEALIGLLQYPVEHLEGSWEGLGVRIAENKAVDALRASEKGLRSTDHRLPIRLVSGDLERIGPDGEPEASIFDTLASEWGNPEAEYIALQDSLQLRDLARAILDTRHQEVFFAIHFRGYSRKEVGQKHGLTSQRIGQIYNAALRTLEAHPDFPYKPIDPVGESARRRNL